MVVKQHSEQGSGPGLLTALLHEFSALTDYRALRDHLPCRLATVLQCRSVLLYLRRGETLQLAAGTFDEQPGWSLALLAVAHIHPIEPESQVPEARAWREQHRICLPETEPTQVIVPLLYRQRCIGVLTVVRETTCWQQEEMELLEAVAGLVALLLENTRLLEHDHAHIQELALLNTMSNQVNRSLYTKEQLCSIVAHYVKEISGTDLCALLLPSEEEDTVAWITPALRHHLFQQSVQQRTTTPFIIERVPMTQRKESREYPGELPDRVQTFFAIPLFSGWVTRPGQLPGTTILRPARQFLQGYAPLPRVLGMIVGGYYHPCTVRQIEMTLLQVLASQVGAALENMRLMGEVVDARNEARKLLHQVIDDQRTKALILENIPSGLLTTDTQGCITTFNYAAAAILGYHPYEVLGQSLHACFALYAPVVSSLSLRAGTEEDQLTTLVHSVLQTGRAVQATVRTTDRYERRLVLEMTMIVLANDEGKRIGALISFSDVTSIHRLEEEKRRLDRLASLGEMAASVAHEVRNPLASIKTAMQLLQTDLLENVSSTATPGPGQPDQADVVRESVGVVLKEVERLDRIVRDLLLFARPRQLHRSHCDLTTLIDHVLKLLQPQWSEAHVLVHRLYEDVPKLWVDVGQMEQVLLNLFMNAIQAMPDGGNLTVTCRRVLAENVRHQDRDSAASIGVPERRSVSVPLYEKQGHSTIEMGAWVELVVGDTGIGISSEQLKHIFQPFYTTKAHGIGLGLAITRRLIEDHQGSVVVESQPGHGTRVIVRLPIVRKEIAQEYVQE